MSHAERSAHQQTDLHQQSDPFRPPDKYGLYDPAFEHDSCGVGFVANIKGVRSRQIIDDADRILRHLVHRGATGCEPNTGDGAGVLTALPHEFLQIAAETDLKVKLPEPDLYGVGNIFLPTEERQRAECKEKFAQIVAEQGQRLLGWRELPTRAKAADIGPAARAAQPAMQQVFIAAADDLDSESFDRQLYVIRKRASRILRTGKLPQALMFYICSLSSRVIVYKGMLTAPQLMPFYPDLQDAEYRSHLAMVHSRFSTNTFPSWDRAIRTATSPTTAKSTRSAATRTGCSPAKA